MTSGFVRKRGTTWMAYFYVLGETGERKREAFAQYGIAEGVRQLATTHPFQPRR